jgi:hypothetical protein
LKNADASHVRPTEERRRHRATGIFPLLRRNEDDEEISKRDPYIKLDKNLRELSQAKFDTIVISPELRYVEGRIAQRFPKAKIISASGADAQLHGEVLCIVNMACRRKHEAYTNLNFRELLAKSPAPREPLHTLYFLARGLSANKKITILSLGEFRNAKIAQKYLQTKKFTNINVISSHIITAQKRPLLQIVFNAGRRTLSEIEDIAGIKEAQEFLSKQFSSKTHHYDIAIDDMFMEHSDFFVVRQTETRAITAVSRHTWQLPNHLLPLMLATKAGSKHHVQLRDPDEVTYGETMLVYEKTPGGSRAYRELINVLFRFLTDFGIDVLFTTYLQGNEWEGAFYQRRYGFHPTGVTLEYGDFGGKWTLVYGPWDGVHKIWTGKPLIKLHEGITQCLRLRA